MADQPKTPPGVDIEVHGHDNVVISGDVGRDLLVTIGGRNVRGEEVAYLDGLIDRYRYWAEKYTPLAGIADVRAAAKSGPRLDLPMLFMPAGFEKLEEHGFGEQRRTERVAVDDLRDAVAKYKRLVLLGEPGSGKTTTLWRLAYDLAVAAKEDPKAPLPLLVPLGGYTGPESALAYAQGYFEELGAYLPAYLRSRRLVLLLDALNEMPQSSYKERVGRIQGLLDQHPDISVVVTCRALDYVETLKLEKLEVKALDPERQRAYLHRYLGEVEGERLFWQMARGPAVADLWHTWQGAGVSWDQFWTATEIPEGVYKRTSTSQDVQWRALRKDGLPPLLVLGRNPFMLVMLAQVYAASEGVLPPNRGRLFAAFVDTLLRREERRCDSAQWPGSEALLGAMSRLAYAMQEAGERGTAVEAAWAAQHLEQPGVDAGRIAYLCASATLLDTSNGQVRFVHQLVQEYFAALALVGRLGAGDDLRSYWPRDWTQPSGWEETFILLAGALPDMAPLVDRLLLVHPALAARCVAESGVHQPDKTRTKVVQQRLLALATSVSVSVAQRNAAGNALDHVGDPRPGIGLRADGLPDIAWCTVLGGEFIMGNTGQTDDNAFDNEAPQCQAELPAFQISKYLITNAQFEAFVQDGGYTELWRGCWTGAGWQRKGERIGPDRHGGVFNLPNHPVVMVTWYEAVAFCNWLSQKLGRSISLPSEAQWERVARHTDGRRYPWGEELTSDHANYYETSIDATSAVGIFPKGASECGALDMSGNVWEWCQTKRRTNYNSLPDDDPEGDARRILRGGSFYLYARYVRCAVRFEDSPNARNRGYGFRVVAASP